jgi:hypothetical protein
MYELLSPKFFRFKNEYISSPAASMRMAPFMGLAISKALKYLSSRVIRLARCPPAECPETNILWGLPPYWLMFSFTHCTALAEAPAIASYCALGLSG